MDIFKELIAFLGRAISKISFDDNSYLDSYTIDEFLVTKRLYDPGELREIIIESRYNIITTCGDWEGGTLDNEAPCQLILASKI